jgi:hypothetical protein
LLIYFFLNLLQGVFFGAQSLIGKYLKLNKVALLLLENEIFLADGKELSLIRVMIFIVVVVKLESTLLFVCLLRKYFLQTKRFKYFIVVIVCVSERKLQRPHHRVGTRLKKNVLLQVIFG